MYGSDVFKTIILFLSIPTHSIISGLKYGVHDRAKPVFLLFDHFPRPVFRDRFILGLEDAMGLDLKRNTDNKILFQNIGGDIDTPFESEDVGQKYLKRPVCVFKIVGFSTIIRSPLVRSP